MWNANLARITGALVFSLAVHTLLLGLAVRPGRGHLPTEGRQSVVIRLTARPIAARQGQAPIAPKPVTVRPRVRATPKVTKSAEVVKPPPPAPPPVAEVAVRVRELPSPAVPESDAAGPERPERPVDEIATAREAAMGSASEVGEVAAGPKSGGGEVVQAIPLYRENPPPVYPGLARRRQWQGTVVLEVLVGAEGRVSELTVYRGSGYSVLDEAALKAVKDWRFTPGRKGEEPVAMRVLVPVRFGLE